MWLLRVTLPVLVLGLLVPYSKGYDFLDAGLLLLYALSPLVLSPTGNIDGRALFRAAAITAIIPIASIGIGLVFIRTSLDYPTTPGGPFLAALALLSIASAFFGVALKAKLTRHFGDAGQARRIVIVSAGTVLVLQILGVQLIPAQLTGRNSMIVLALAASFLMFGCSFYLVRR